MIIYVLDMLLSIPVYHLQKTYNMLKYHIESYPLTVGG